MFKLIGPDHKIVVDAYDDPGVRGVIDPFTKVERVFAAKPATVKIKSRALKKLKDAAL